METIWCCNACRQKQPTCHQEHPNTSLIRSDADYSHPFTIPEWHFCKVEFLYLLPKSSFVNHFQSMTISFPIRDCIFVHIFWCTCQSLLHFLFLPKISSAFCTNQMFEITKSSTYHLHFPIPVFWVSYKSTYFVFWKKRSYYHKIHPTYIIW